MFTTEGEYHRHMRSLVSRAFGAPVKIAVEEVEE
jgi:cytochrome P450